MQLDHRGLDYENFYHEPFHETCHVQCYSKKKLLAVADTKFVSWIIILKRFKLIKRNLQDLVLSDRWNMYRDYDVGQAQFVKEKVLDLQWDKINYFIAYPIYDMLRVTDTDTPSLHLVYGM